MKFNMESMDQIGILKSLLRKHLKIILKVQEEFFNYICNFEVFEILEICRISYESCKFSIYPSIFPLY